MTLLLSSPVHPYLREIKFSEGDLATFVRHERCPACNSDQTPVDLVELGQENWSKRVHLVQCRDCDHVYYLNPPSSEFFARFYSQEWNSGRGETLRKPASPSRKVKRTAAVLLEDLGLRDKRLAVLDIGCGLGTMLAGLEREGYRDLHGTEASDYRAAVSAARFPERIFAGGYESVPEGLTFDVIYSNHVFEHIYSPRDALAWAVGRLRPGGIIAVSVPHALGEPVVNQLLFLPHLHSFCHRSLIAMGRAQGLDCLFWQGANAPYEVTAVFFREGEAPPADPARIVPAENAPEATPRSQIDRIQQVFRSNGRSRRDVHFALHGSESDSVRMAAEGGVREVGPLGRLFARMAGPPGRVLTGIGLRKLGDKRLARIRYVSGRFTGRDENVPVVGSLDGKLVFHIK